MDKLILLALLATLATAFAAPAIPLAASPTKLEALSAASLTPSVRAAY